MNNNLATQLQEIGLSKTEATIYLAGLQIHGPLSANELQKETGIKRPTVYHALNTLAAKGLVGKSSDEGKVLFIFSEPSQLPSFVRSRLFKVRDTLETAQQLSLMLDKIAPTDTAERASSVRQYKGAEGVRAAIEDALNCSSREWSIIAPKKNFFSEFDKSYATYFMKSRRQKGIRSRSLWEHGFTSRGDAYKTFKRDRNPRHLPKSTEPPFKSVMILYDDKIAIISSLSKLSAIVVQSQEVHELMSTMFNLLWERSSPYKNNASTT